MNLRSVRRHIYSQRDRWKWVFFVIASVIISASLWYTNRMVNEFGNDERRNIKVWAETIKKKAEFVSHTEEFFNQIKSEEDKKVQLLAKSYKQILSANSDSELSFIVDIIKDNDQIPVVVTYSDTVHILKNTDSSYREGQAFGPERQKAFSKYSPIDIPYDDLDIKLYYKPTKIFERHKEVLDNLVNTFFNEVAVNSASVPVIITDSTRRNVVRFGNLPAAQMKDSVFVQHTLNKMASENQPIRIDFVDQGMSYIYYLDSPYLNELKYFNLVLIFIIAVFVFVAYSIFSTTRRSEQNQVWVGMSKETAHQLGTPLSSLIGWVELLRMENVSEEVLGEIDKDLVRLQRITERFSKVGSPPELVPDNLVEIIYDAVGYLRPRTSRKVEYILNIDPEQCIILPLNRHLFGWVIENLCKNAIDAMSGAEGSITINLKEDSKYVYIDVKDTGKGIPKRKFKRVFYPGYTTKKRGWGLGLSLVKRIIKNNHKGKIFVKSSVLDKGTTFRIVLRKG